MSPAGDGCLALPAGPSGATCRFAREAMGTTCEIIIVGQEASYAGQAARAAFDELDRLELELSRFIECSDVSQINALAAGGPPSAEAGFGRAGGSVRVGVAAWECLQLARRLGDETGGAFDVTLGAGMDRLALDEADHAVAVLGEGVSVDLGGIGKGYAVDRMVAVLGDWSIDAALVHAGESTVFAVGSPAGERAWTVGIRDPAGGAESLGSVRLRDRALSGSGLSLHGRHIVDPRTGQPVGGGAGQPAAWCSAPTAAVADALSTAFMVMAPGQIERYCGQHSDIWGMLLSGDSPDRRLERFGSWNQ